MEKVKASSLPNLIETLYDQGIHDESVLRAIASVPRDQFVSDFFRQRAYDNEALPIECGQTISQPYTVARMTSLIHPYPGMKVLEIGTGSGYQAAILAKLGCRVWSIERHIELHEEARERLARLGYNVALRLGDGSIGWSEFSPYDAILVTAAAPDVPTSLVNQLDAGGRLVIPVGDRRAQQLIVVRKEADGTIREEDYGEFKFVPLIGKRGFDA